MCGIAGYLGGHRLEQTAIARTLELMHNRGPDYRAEFHSSGPAGAVHLLHSRLSIIDLDPRSHQPFHYADYSLVFNGEIYNYRELRNDLIKRGLALTTESDTEVLLHYFILFGEKCLERLEGMWAFAIYHKPSHRLFLSRDRFGEKPLYLYRNGTGLYFGSEVKFIKSLSGQNFSINEKHLLRYLVNGYQTLYKTEEKFYKGLRSLPAGTLLEMDVQGESSPRRYWRPRSQPRQGLALTEAIEGFRERFIKSVELRLRSDVPLAFCLSGGVDSSSIACVAAKHFNCQVETFSIIDQDPRYNELGNITATIKELGCKSTQIPVSTSGFFDRLRRLISYHDCPISTISYYVHSFLSEAIAAHGFKVALSGSGADELVTGYYHHFLLQLCELRGRPEFEQRLRQWQEHILPMVRNPLLRDPALFLDNPGFIGHSYQDREIFLSLLRVPFAEEPSDVQYCESPLRNKMLNEMFHDSIPVILHEDDLNSMLFSLENRSPFLDSTLFDFCHSIPPEHLIVDGYGKYILRESMKGFVPDSVRLDRMKKGFNASINSLVDFGDKNTQEYLLDPASEIFRYIDRNRLLPLMAQSPAPNSISKFLFNFINTKIFLELN